MTKLEQCKTCAHDEFCDTHQEYDACEKCGAWGTVTVIIGYTTKERDQCRCLKVRDDEQCPYYKEVHKDDQA